MTDSPEFTSPSRRDKVLMRELALGDEEALRTLVEIFGRCVYGKTLQMLQEPHLAEEIAQETLLVLWWEPHRFDPSRGSLVSFLMGEARSRAIDAIRDEQITRGREALLSETKRFFDPRPADGEFERSVVVRAALSDLSSSKREVVFLGFYKGLPYPEVASVLGLAEDTVVARIRDSFLRLEGLLNLDHDRHSA